ncbi:MAG: PH domain-containing protein, partial [Bacteroidota bacterium]
MTLPADFFAPSRQSPIAILLFLLKFLKLTIRHAWPVVLYMVFSLRKVEFADWLVYVLFAVIGAAYVASSVLSYLRFRYQLKGGEIVITKGILTRTTVNLPFEKIQTIDFKQNVLQQLFGVVELAIDSAGSKKQEVSLTAVPIERAEALREYVLEEKKHYVDTQQEETISAQATPQSKVILTLGVGDLLKVGITQNHIKSLGLIFVFFIGLFE